MTNTSDHKSLRDHLRAALHDGRRLQSSAGQSPEGRSWSIIVTDLEKLIATEMYYFH